jgi:hypothetical protein
MNSSYTKGHKYLTLVHRIDEGIIRLLWVGRESTAAKGGYPGEDRWGSGGGKGERDDACRSAPGRPRMT